jgi:hypothetical protein
MVRRSALTALHKVGYGLGYNSLESGVRTKFTVGARNMPLSDVAVRAIRPRERAYKVLFALYRLGYKGRMTGHGFRGLASTILHENGFEDEHVELQLAHQKRNRVAAAYNHAKYLNQRKTMMQWWADYLDAQLGKGRQSTIGIRADRFAGPAAAPNRRKSSNRIKQPIATRTRAVRPTV